MIQMYSRLNVADNSGVKQVRCIKLLGKGNKTTAQLGDIITVSVRSVLPNSEVKKKSVVKAVIVRQIFPYRRKNGTIIRFDNNAVVLIDNEKNPKGTRIIGPVARELRTAGFSKIVSLASEVL